jgi:HTH-type transcriptional regulator/antitoxin HigA
MLTEIRPIRTEADHEAVLAEIWRLMEQGPEPGSPEGDRLEVLALLSEAYEAKRYPIEPADPIDAIEFMMEQKGLDRSDLEPALGQSGRVSEVLNRRRPLSINMIRALVGLLDIPADVLVRPYPLTGASTVVEDEGSTGAGALVYAFRKPPVTHHHGATNSNHRMRAAAAKRAPGAVAKKPAVKTAAAAKKPAAKKAADAKRSTGTLTIKRTPRTTAKRPSSSRPSGSGRGGRPTSSRR